MQTTTYPSVGWGKETFQPLNLSQTACEFEWTVQPGGSVPEHLHQEANEHFKVLEGEVTFKLGGKTIVAKAGDEVVIPRQILHSVSNKSNGVTRCLVWFTPAADQSKFFQILLFLKGENQQGMKAVLQAMFISNQLNYKEFSTVKGGMKVVENLMMRYFKLTAPLTGWDKLVRRFVQGAIKPVAG